MTKKWTNTPHIDPAWANDFLIEARTRSYSGSAIASALAEVDGHLAESGENAYEAFGDPAEYAAGLDLPAEPGQEVGYSTMTAPLIGVVGMLVSLWGITGLKEGGSTSLSWGTVLSLVLLVASVVALIRWSRAVFAGLARSKVVLLAFVVLPLAVFVSLQLGLRARAFDVPAWPALVTGLVLLGVHVVLTRRDTGRAMASGELVGPIDGDPTGTLRASRATDTAVRLTAYQLPFFTAIFALVVWFL